MTLSLTATGPTKGPLMRLPLHSFAYPTRDFAGLSFRLSSWLSRRLKVRFLDSSARFGLAVPLLAALVIFSICLLVPDSSASAAPLYKVYDKHGRVTYSTKRPRAGKKFRRLRSSSIKYSKAKSISSSRRSRSKVYRSHGWKFSPKNSRYDSLIKSISYEHQIPPALVKAVIHVESAFNPKARSPKGATGLMQLMPATARRFGVKRIWEPEENIRGGVKYLSWLKKKFNGDLTKMLAGYNAGENAVIRFGGVPPYKETQNYVKRVRKAFDGYKKNSS